MALAAKGSLRAPTRPHAFGHCLPLAKGGFRIVKLPSQKRRSWTSGRWNIWTDKASGEIHDPCAMPAINAGAHPVMRRMRKPDPKLGPAEQDRRSVASIEPEDADASLFGTPQQAAGLLPAPAMEVMDAGPA